MTKNIVNFLRKDDGVTAIEYGLIGSLIAVMIIAGATAIGIGLDDLFLVQIAPNL